MQLQGEYDLVRRNEVGLSCKVCYAGMCLDVMMCHISGVRRSQNSREKDFI